MANLFSSLWLDLLLTAHDLVVFLSIPLGTERYIFKFASQLPNLYVPRGTFTKNLGFETSHLNQLIYYLVGWEPDRYNPPCERFDLKLV